ncbi:glycosyltransferase family 4 protein [Derxia lacustris]|uniref:glycosyltransferase family 4 protein n=1 Tax=Derxia lacustris TaxID=764842 RepID=UPI000A170563|nr:glycosyltransferase family 1 protein [Derxia lacustris]
MRIAIATDAWHPQVNGVVRSTAQLVDALVAAGHEVKLLSGAGLPGFALPSYPEIRLAWAPGRQVAEWLDGFAPDAVHIATEGTLGHAARSHCLKRDWPFTTHYHTRFPEYLALRTGLPTGPFYRWLRHFHGPAARVMVPGAGVLADLERHGFRNAVLMPNGVDTALFRPDAAGALPAGFEDLPRPIFTTVGRVAVEKNLDAFLRLDLPGSKVVCGDGPARARLQRQYPQAFFAGQLDTARLAQVYRASDVFVFPSRTDTFGLVLLEALACGTPVAAYPVSGPVDVIGDSPAGALDADLRSACLRALELPRPLARAHALRFSWASVAERFVGQLARIERMALA